MRAVRLVPLALVVGCSELLGGLEEARTRSDPSADASVDATGSDNRCAEPWLAEFEYRKAIDVQSADAFDDIAFAVTLDARSLVVRHRLRSDGNDLRVTLADGTVIPHQWSGLESEAARLWVRTRLPAGRSRLLVYYGSPDAPPPQASRVFIDGILPVQPFGGSDWRNGTIGPVERTDDRLTLRSTMEYPTEACITLALPSDRAFDIVFDLVSVRGQGTPYVAWGTNRAWAGQGWFPVRDLSAGLLPTGRNDLCFGLKAQVVGEPIEATFANVRLIPHAYSLPERGVGPEETRCPRDD